MVKKYRIEIECKGYQEIVDIKRWLNSMENVKVQDNTREINEFT